MNEKDTIIRVFANVLERAVVMCKAESHNMHELAIATDDLLQRLSRLTKPIPSQEYLEEFLKKFRALCRTRYFDNQMVVSALQTSSDQMLSVLNQIDIEEDLKLQ